MKLGLQMPGVQFGRAQAKILIVGESAVHRQNVQGFAMGRPPRCQTLQSAEGVVADEIVGALQNQLRQTLTISAIAHLDF